MNLLAITLASYNGSEFLSQQVESIYKQMDEQSILFVRDDGSKDLTPKLLGEFEAIYPNIKLVVDDEKSSGAAANFSLLLEYAYSRDVSHVMLSDQDDVWVEDKIALQIALMHKMEKEVPESPLLIHSDMTVVDRELQTISPSFMQYQAIRHEAGSPLKVLLAQNFIAGCTMLVNRRLLDIALPIPEETLMHDWWLALCAAVFGYIGFIDKPLVKYRQHAGNEVGAKHISDFLNPMTGKWKKRWLEGRENLFQSMQQARVLAERIREHDPKNPHLALVEAYAALASLSPLQRVKRINELGVHAQAQTRQILLLSRLLLTPRVQP